MLRTPTVTLVSALLLLMATPAWAHTPLARDLPTLLQQQGFDDETAKVVLVLVSQPDCLYCRDISRELLGPMQNSEYYQRTTVFIRIEINTGHNFLDFDGQQVSASDFAGRYDITLTPTLLFLDHQGQPLDSNLVGYTTPDLFGYYLDQALQQSWQLLNPIDE